MAYGIVEGTTHEELEGKVVGPFRSLAGVVQLRLVPFHLFLLMREFLDGFQVLRTRRLSRTERAAA